MNPHLVDVPMGQLAILFAGFYITKEHGGYFPLSLSSLGIGGHQEHACDGGFFWLAGSHGKHARGSGGPLRGLRGTI
jgi:hypothetical protein